MKECPFCGNDGTAVEMYMGEYHVFCIRCRACGPRVTDRDVVVARPEQVTPQELARARWNERAADKKP